jgi:hypothetical protein
LFSPLLLFSISSPILSLQAHARAEYKRKEFSMLTKDSKTVLYHLYKEYCVRRSNGISRSNAKEFHSSESVQKLLFPDWSVSDVDDCMCELGRNGYLSNHHASDLIYDSTLTDKAIVTMENQKKETLLNVVNFLTQFIP